MTTSRRNLRWFGLLGLGAGLLLIVAAPLGGEVAGLMRGYGSMLAASAAYMLGGLWLLAFRARRPAGSSQPSTEPTPTVLHRV